MNLWHYACEKRWRLFLRTFREVNVDVSVNETKAIFYFFVITITFNDGFLKFNFFIFSP
jgi:hypothetical protein